MKKTILIAVLLTSTKLLADDITTLSGTKYQNITVTRVEPNGISITHSDGIAKILFADMPEELRKKYGYDPKKADQFTQAEQAAAIKRAAATATAAQQRAAANEATLKQNAKEQRIASETEEFWIVVTQVGDGGAIVRPALGAMGTRSWELFGGNSAMTIAVKGLTGVAEGEGLAIQTYRDGNRTFSGRTLQNWVFVKRVAEPKNH